MSDPDSIQVLLSFCDHRTRLQLARTCRAHHLDVQRYVASRPHLKHAADYVAQATHTRSTGPELAQHLSRHHNDETLVYALVRVWLASTQSDLDSDQLFAFDTACMSSDQTYIRWSVPANSHVRQHMCESLCTHSLPTELTLRVTPSHTNPRLVFTLSPVCPMYNRIVRYACKRPGLWCAILHVLCTATNSRVFDWIASMLWAPE